MSPPRGVLKSHPLHASRLYRSGLLLHGPLRQWRIQITQVLPELLDGVDNAGLHLLLLACQVTLCPGDLRSIHLDQLLKELRQMVCQSLDGVKSRWDDPSQ